MAFSFGVWLLADATGCDFCVSGALCHGWAFVLALMSTRFLAFQKESLRKFLVKPLCHFNQSVVLSFSIIVAYTAVFLNVMYVHGSRSVFGMV